MDTLYKAETFEQAINNHSILTLDSVKDNDKLFKFYTGFPDYKTFHALSTYLKPKAINLQYYGGGKKRKLSGNFKNKSFTRKPGPERQITPEEELFMTLCRLRLGVPTQEWALHFGLKVSTYESIFNTWVVLSLLNLSPFAR